jgi:hypothetical protein
MVDRYTKIVLTVIAACLLWLCLWGPAPKWGTPAEASGVYDSYRRARDSWVPPAGGQPAKIEGQVEGQPYGTPLRVDIVAVGGKELQMGLLTSFSGMSSVSGLPVEVRGTVPVDVNGPVEVEGTVNVRER